MSRPQAARPFSSREPDMYDDTSPRQGSSDHNRRSPPQDRQESWKDHSRNPHRGPAVDRMNNRPPGRGQWHQHDNGYAGHRDERQDEQTRPRGEARGRYNDRDREDYRSPRRERSRSRSRERSPYYGAPPSRTIILEGIPMKMTQEDIFDEIQHSLKVENLEEIRLIKDKKTGLSRQFAFAQFATLENARAFLDRYYPTIQLYGAYDPTQSKDFAGAPVRIAYSREKEDKDRAGSREDDWKCDICYLVNYSHRMFCFRCNAPRNRPTTTGLVSVANQPKMSTFSGFATTGDTDVSPDNSASQFLLFRGLEPGVNEELLAKAVTKLYKVPISNQAEAGNKKTKIVSTSSDATLGAKDGSLRRVLLVRDRKSNDSWRYGFAEFSTVEDAQAAMAKYNSLEKFTISSKPVLISYIHAGVFVPVLQATSQDLDRFTFSPLSNPAVRLMYWDEAGYVSERINPRDESSALDKARASVTAKLAAASGNEGSSSGNREGEAKSKKRKVEKEISTSSKKVIAPHLQFWSSRHAELHGLPTKEGDDTEDTQSATDSKEERPSIEPPPSQSFADMDRKCCLLCSRQFKTEDEVSKHERVSQLHRDNTMNDDLKKKALAKLAKSRAVQTEAESSAYRDRAKERRQAFNQPKQPAAQHNKGPKEPSTLAQPAAEDVVPVPSKGAALLGKMGWTAGEGLGAQGTGMKDAITTEMYTQGVGLGAEGGKIGNAIEEAERSTKGSYADFVSKSKDKAKERFEGMS